MVKCEICGEVMPDGEEMFKYHGSSGPCPKPPLKKPPMRDDVVVSIGYICPQCKTRQNLKIDPADHMAGLKEFSCPNCGFKNSISMKPIIQQDSSSDVN